MLTLKDLENKIPALKDQLAELNFEMQVEGFWDDPARGTEATRKKGNLEAELGKIEGCLAGFSDAEEYEKLALESGDSEVAALAQQLRAEAEMALEEISVKALLNGPCDQNNAILSIHPGAGGLDSQDWGAMLLRMYTRWAENKGYKVMAMDIQSDPEAGIKSAEILVQGDYAYGYLKAEKGVHRLVRISPYNANNKRQTSFTSVDVVPELSDKIEVEINPEDLRIDTYRSSGAGGQHVNKTDSAVRITHIPTGIVVTCQNERSQIQNREYAMRALKSKLYALALEEHKDKISELTGDHSQISWGNQIRNYVLQPYTLVKDARTGYETSNVKAVLDGDLDEFINAALSCGSFAGSAEKEEK